MSIEIARGTLDLTMRLIAQQASQRRQALEMEVAVVKKTQATQEAAVDLLTATLDNLGQLIDTFA